MASAIFVLPVATSGQQGPVAAWVSTAGWASAASRVLGPSWIVTPEGVLEPYEVRRRGSDPQLRSPVAQRLRRHVPTVAKTFVKDVRRWRAATRFRVSMDGPWSGTDLAFVWQRHELFHTAGLDLARALGVPSVLFVPAPLVWEATAWRVPRPGWGRWLERHGERPSLLAADLVACGSHLVAEQVRRLGVPEHRILVTPTGVDLDAFPVRARRDDGRSGSRSERLTVGWVGSFRGFHALELLVDAAARVEGVELLLVGDGPERAAVLEAAASRGVPVRCTGTVSHTALPAALAEMDVAVVLGRANEPFHYSPLKLAEYLAAGVPVVAPAVPQISGRLRHGREALLVELGDVEELAGALRQLRDDPSLRVGLAAAGRAAAESDWSWDVQVKRVLGHLAGLRSSCIDLREPRVDLRASYVPSDALYTRSQDTGIRELEGTRTE